MTGSHIGGGYPGPQQSDVTSQQVGAIGRQQTLERLAESHGDLAKTDSPNFLCTPLPQHWRVNKSLQTPFKGKYFNIFISNLI